MIKNYFFTFFFICFAVNFSFGQVTTIDFETAGDGYTPSTTFGTTGNTDIFNRTGTAINGNSTFHWAAEDISGNPTISLDQIDIIGSTSFTFAVDFSYDNAAQWDATDELLITYSIDGGTYQNLMAVQHINNDAFNEPAALDLNFDGNGDVGQELSTTAFLTFTTPSIALSGNSTLDIEFQFNNLTSNGEGILIDNIVIDVAGPTGPIITVTQATGGTISPGTTSVTSGDDLSFSATTDACHSFTNWEVDGVDVGNAIPYTFTNITTDHTITAVYTADTYNITSTAGANGSITPNGSTSVTCGTDQTYNFTADAGYAVASVLVDGVSVGAVTSYDFINVTASHTISVTFMTYIAPCGSESFNNSNATNSYADNSFVGDNGVTWTYIASRDENGDANGSGINGNALMLRRASDNSRVTSSSVPNGIGDFSVKLYKGFTAGGSRQVELFVNGISQGTSTIFDDFNEHIFSVSGINIAGNVIVELRNTFGSQIIVDDIEWSCYSPCTPTHTVTSFAPTEGPVGTLVTILGDDFSNTTSVSFNGLSASNITYIDSDGDSVIDTLLAEVPAGTTTGDITIIEAGCDITSASSFNIIDTSGGCLSSTLSDLIITELYDKQAGSLGYIEVFNGTGSAVNLSGYSIRRYGDTDDVCSGFYTLYTFPVTTPTINNNGVLYGKIFSPAEPADDATPDFTYDVDCSNTGGGLDCDSNTVNVNNSCGGFNGSDIFHLYNGASLVDVYENQSSGIGYTVLRDPNTVGPNTTSNPSDWTYNSSEDTSDLGAFVYTGSITSFPTTTNPATSVGSCLTTVSYTANGTASLGGALTYQWYFNDGVSASWSLVNATNLAQTIVSGETSTTLTLTNGLYNYDYYQFYCLVTESGFCSTVSTAAQLKIGTAKWDGANWIWNDGTALNTPPSSLVNVIIDGEFETFEITNGETSFEACNCTVTDTHNLLIDDYDYVLVQNNLIVDGSIVVRPYGSFVQVNDAGTVTGNILTDKSKISVIKKSAIVASYFEYTYWSSPVSGEIISDGLAEANPNNIYWYNGQNFIDATRETNNDNTTVAGQDDIDDNADDWQFATGATTMAPGVGYAATQNTFAFFPTQIDYDFEGPFNNGVYNVPIYRNDSETNDNNWNFIGNPYPSAIDADLFLAANASIDQSTNGAVSGAIFFWSHNTTADGNTNGNENLNYEQSDYAIINGSGETMGGDGVMPSRHIPSGQGFFVSMDNAAPSTGGTIRTTNVVFNNSMRVTGNNSQFFRANDNNNNRLWLNLTTDNGVLNQTLIAYVNGATDGNDGMYYDAERNPSTDTNAIIYTLLDNSNEDKFAIQGKEPNGLTLDEVIPLGFKTSIDVATLYTISVYQFEGVFMSDNTVYLKDNNFNTYHNLTLNDYTFTSEPGIFNNRFEIVFKPQALSIDDNVMDANSISIVELNDGQVQFKLNSKALSISNVEILDVLGRRIYNLQANSATEVYNLSKLSQAAYIAKITLSNGQVISKKAVKQQ